MATPQDLLAATDKSITAKKKQISSLEAKIKALKKPNPKDKKATARYNTLRGAYNKSLTTYKADLGKLSETRVGQQNKVYEVTGQYDKLLKGTERDAYMALNALFKNYNLQTLSGKIFDYVKNGYSADTISILLQDTAEYKKRFAGNEARKAAGLPVLNPSEYLATEASYRQIMQSAGLPPGFYDQSSDFDGWIGKNVSPSEIQSRVDLATQATVLANPNYRKALNAMGISDSDLTAYFLDSSRALPHLQKSAATAAIGAQALNQGLTFDKTYAEQLALKGISSEEAEQGYSSIATELETMKALGQIYGSSWGQRESEQATLEGQGEAINKKGRLLSRERSTFSGSSGTGRAGLAQQGGAR